MHLHDLYYHMHARLYMHSAQLFILCTSHLFKWIMWCMMQTSPEHFEHGPPLQATLADLAAGPQIRLLGLDASQAVRHPPPPWDRMPREHSIGIFRVKKIYKVIGNKRPEASVGWMMPWGKLLGMQHVFLRGSWWMHQALRQASASFAAQAESRKPEGKTPMRAKLVRLEIERPT